MTDYTKLVNALRCNWENFKTCKENECPYLSDERWCDTDRLLSEAADAIEELQKRVPKLIRVSSRPMDEDERKEWSEKLGYDLEDDEAVIYTSQLPDDGQEVLVYGRWGRIWIDKFENDPDYGCSFYENGGMDGIVAWMPLPEIPKEE